MTDRVVGALLVLVGGAAVFLAVSWEVRFAGDPVGPRAFPAFAGSAPVLCGAAIGFAPREGARWPGLRCLLLLVAAVAWLAAYAATLRLLGFLPTTAAVLAGGALLFGARLIAAAAYGILGSVALWALIDRGRDIPLPRGVIG